MTVCFNKLGFPIPNGLLRRPVVTAYAGGLDLSLYPITYAVEGSDDLGNANCCGGAQSIVWPSGAPQGALYPVSEGTYEFTATVDTGVDGRVELTPARLVVVDGAACVQAECDPCLLVERGHWLHLDEVGYY